MKCIAATIAMIALAVNAGAAAEVVVFEKGRGNLAERSVWVLPPGQSGPFGGYSSSPDARYNREGTGGGASDPGKSTSGGNAGNYGPASNPATGQAGKPQTNSGVAGTPSNP